MKLNHEEVMGILPHRPPMLLVDTVEELIPGDSIITKFYVDPDRDIFIGHFPSEPILPGVYSVECMAQAADVLLLSDERCKGKLPLFIGIDHVRFLSKISPGDMIEIHAKLIGAKLEKMVFTCYSEVYDNNILAATGEVSLAMR